MAARDGRSADDIRRDIETEREQLAGAVENLRAELGEVTNLSGKMSAVVAAGALSVGFFLAGGIGATMRLVARRGREGRTVAKFGPFSLVDRE
jgi:Protein of unknown function (DUF3618)